MIKQSDTHGLIATLHPGASRDNAGQYRRDNHFYRSVEALTHVAGDIVSVAELRLYATPARTYASVWLGHPSKQLLCGSAMSSGHGYDRASAAAWGACRAAGVKFNKAWEGAGNTFTEGAMVAIAEALGHPASQVYLCISHG